MSNPQYPGTELDVFAHARNWKAYLKDVISPWLRGHVLEVGAGIGGTTSAFRDSTQESWTALEPDGSLAERLRARVADARPPVDVRVGSISTLPDEPRFDCILYIDVLEHIEDDAGELRLACARLAPQGAVVILSPAHDVLYSPFDAAIGHHRRYSRRQLAAITPETLRLVHTEYIDTVGLLLSAGNRLILRSAAPSLAQVVFWDRRCIPLSRRLDRALGGRVGKSILAIWRKPA
jgi:SAM-dependent methyltransferase